MSAPSMQRPRADSTFERRRRALRRHPATHRLIERIDRFDRVLARSLGLTAVAVIVGMAVVVLASS